MAHKIANGVDAHELTDEDRAKAAETRRRKREEAQQAAEAALLLHLDTATAKHGELLQSDDEQVVSKMVREAYDRTMGRPTQRTEITGDVVLKVNIEKVRDELDTLIEREAAAKREPQ